MGKMRYEFSTNARVTSSRKFLVGSGRAWNRGVPYIESLRLEQTLQPRLPRRLIGWGVGNDRHEGVGGGDPVASGAARTPSRARAIP